MRGRATAQYVARWFRGRGWPWAQARTGAMTGQDIDNMPGLSPEVKATSDVPLLAALRQARRNAGTAVPFVVWRPNGYGPEKIGEWVAALTLDDLTTLLAEAGYGDGNRHEFVQYRNGGPAVCSCGAERLVRVIGTHVHPSAEPVSTIVPVSERLVQRDDLGGLYVKGDE